jgi:hypothetical protein
LEFSLAKIDGGQPILFPAGPAPAGAMGVREMDQQSRREAWLITSGIVLVPLVAALAVLSQMLLQ